MSRSVGQQDHDSSIQILADLSVESEDFWRIKKVRKFFRPEVVCDRLGRVSPWSGEWLKRVAEFVIERQGLKIKYSTWGSVRGSCRHTHKTLEAAEVCCTRDAQRCANLPGGNAYSDQVVVREAEHDKREGVPVMGNPAMGWFTPLTDAEREQLLIS